MNKHTPSIVYLSKNASEKKLKDLDDFDLFVSNLSTSVYEGLESSINKVLPYLSYKEISIIVNELNPITDKNKILLFIRGLPKEQQIDILKENLTWNSIRERVPLDNWRDFYVNRAHLNILNYEGDYQLYLLKQVKLTNSDKSNIKKEAYLLYQENPEEANSPDYGKVKDADFKGKINYDKLLSFLSCGYTGVPTDYFDSLVKKYSRSMANIEFDNMLESPKDWGIDTGDTPYDPKGITRLKGKELYNSLISNDILSKEELDKILVENI